MIDRLAPTQAEHSNLIACNHGRHSQPEILHDHKVLAVITAAFRVIRHRNSDAVLLEILCDRVGSSWYTHAKRMNRIDLNRIESNRPTEKLRRHGTIEERLVRVEPHGLGELLACTIGQSVLDLLAGDSKPQVRVDC